MKQLFLAIAAGTLLCTSTIGTAGGAEHAGKSAEHAGKSAEHAGKKARSKQSKTFNRSYAQLSLLQSMVELDLSGSNTPGTHRDASDLGLRFDLSHQIEKRVALVANVVAVDYGDDVDNAFTRFGLGMAYFNNLANNRDAQFSLSANVESYDFGSVDSEGLTLRAGLRGRIICCMELSAGFGLILLDGFDGYEFRTGVTYPLRDRVDVYGGLTLIQLEDDKRDRVEWTDLEVGMRYRF